MSGADPLDPFGHFTMGQARWLHDDLEGSLPWLEQANALNPNYTQARYSIGWAEAVLGSVDASRRNIAAALALSPLNPLVHGMLGVQALWQLTLNDKDQAAKCAERAARSSGAHPLIEMIAAVAHGLNDDEPRAKVWAASVRTRAAYLNKTDVERAFPFRDAATRARVSGMLTRLGRGFRPRCRYSSTSTDALELLRIGVLEVASGRIPGVSVANDHFGFDTKYEERIRFATRAS